MSGEKKKRQSPTKGVDPDLDSLLDAYQSGNLPSDEELTEWKVR